LVSLPNHSKQLTLSEPVVHAYRTKTVEYAYRGSSFTFALSHGLFSSAAIDSGSRFLLTVFAQTLDTDARSGNPPPRTVLDAGCGIGVLGICAARALSPNATLRCQDRDELARCFTEYNARCNNIPPELLSAHTEPLLAGPPDTRWDLILSNIPAKAGAPVLDDFITRSARLLTATGRALIVVVNPLADFFRARIQRAGTPLLEASGKGHTVMMYGPPVGQAPSPSMATGAFYADYPAYHRHSAAYTLADVAYTLDTVHGVADFDTPSEASRLAAKLLRRVNRQHVAPLSTLLIHEPSQGHFARWLTRFLDESLLTTLSVTLSGRNIVALEASRHNLRDASLRRITLVPAVDVALSHQLLSESADDAGFSAAFLFPEPVPQTAALETQWEGLDTLLIDGGLALIALPSSDAERFDRKKPPRFKRLGELKRNGFRALAYQKMRKEE
jgi:16S rRNA G1207 methylase RsmC